MAQLIDRANAAGHQSSVLSVKRGRWRTRGGVEPTEKEFVANRVKALARDDNTCVECGTRVSVGMEVHHKNDIHEDNAIKNLATECPLCHATHHIGFVGKNGLIIYTPELEQQDIFNLIRVCVIALEHGDDAQKQAVNDIFAALEASSKQVHSTWGSSNPLDFADSMMNLPESVYADRELSMRGLHLMFKRDVATKIPHIKTIQRVGESFGSMPPSTWGGIVEKITSKIAERMKSAGEIIGG